MPTDEELAQAIADLRSVLEVLIEKIEQDPNEANGSLGEVFERVAGAIGNLGGGGHWLAGMMARFRAAKGLPADFSRLLRERRQRELDAAAQAAPQEPQEPQGPR